MRRRICVVITARPSYSRIKTALTAIAAHPALELQIVVAASALLERYGNPVHFLEQEGFEVAAKVYMVLEGASPTTMAKTTGLGVIELATVLDNLRPHIVLTVADRYETLATALAAAYMNLPVAHVQGGEVTGSIDERVRHAVTKLADLHFVSSEAARARVVRMGEEPARVFVTGCPSIDLAVEMLKDPALDFDPSAKYGGVGAPVDLSNGYVVVMQHPVTTEYEQARAHVTETLHAVRDHGVPALWFWPNVDAGSDATSNGIRTFRELEQPANLHFFKNMSPLDFLKLFYNAKCLVGNSSAGIREGAFLGVPVVNIGSRQSGRDRAANVVDVSYDRTAIGAAMRAQIARGRHESDGLYGCGEAGTRIAELLAQVAVGGEKRLTY